MVSRMLNKILFQFNNIIIPKLTFTIENTIYQGRYCLTRSKKNEKFFFIGHHKCATQYIKNIIQDVCIKRKIPVNMSGGDWYKTLTPRILGFNKFICIQNYEHGAIRFSDYQYKAFHVIRDLRDILVSQYFSHKDSHPLTHSYIIEDHDKLVSCSKDEGIRYLITESRFFRKLVNEISNWSYDDRNVYETTFERLTGNPFEEFSAIFSFLGIEIDNTTLTGILTDNQVSNLRLKHAKKLSGAKANHYRKGVPGDWENHLKDKNKELFKQEYGDILIKLNYEKDANW